MLYIGIDLGTSACKFLLVDEQGSIRNEVTKEYPLYFPHPGWSEQNPEDWWKACLEGIPELLKGFDASQVAGIGVGGQMHGLVAMDENDRVMARQAGRMRRSSIPGRCISATGMRRSSGTSTPA